ncbi:arginine deiminase-related protein [Flavicella sp.]|uniref:arginine deiminase-related protein n=1 Tax=Flavicella sp. TaxID=2957742 RepID=UPI003015C93A
MMNLISNAFLVVRPLEKRNKLIDEYNLIIEGLRSKGINIIELTSKEHLLSTKYLCSGHWISSLGKGVVVVYPMSSLGRQQERNDLVFDLLGRKGFKINDVVDFTEAENEGFFLEGTGSIVLDRLNCVAYVSVSKCSDEELFVEFCEELEFTPVIFRSSYSDGLEVLHTSRILTVTESFSIVASCMVKDKKERKMLSLQLKKSGRDLIYISEQQVENYVTDIKQVKNDKGDSFVVMSKSIFDSLYTDQKNTLGKHGEFLVFDCREIERQGKHSIGSILNDIFS